VAYRRRSSTSSGPSVVPIAGAFLVVLAVIAGAVWWFTRSAEDSGEPTPSSFDAADTTGMSSRDREPPPPLDLPELDASDAFVRRMVATLSSHPDFARFLVPDRLVNRFVRTVADLAGGFYPAEHVPHLRPDAPFAVREEGGRTVIDPASYRRYDPLASTFASLDPAGTVRLFRQMRPLIDEAWNDLGAPGDFDEALRLALGNLRAVQVPAGSVEVVRNEAVWSFADPELEARRGAAKALIRTGPDNARRIQAQLEALERELQR
jgi:hypothetical protein